MREFIPPIHINNTEKSIVRKYGKSEIRIPPHTKATIIKTNINKMTGLVVQFSEP